MRNSSTFLRFLHLTQAIASQWGNSKLDLTALRLLEIVAVTHYQGKPLTVTDAMSLGFIASPATLHRKLDQLRETGFINLAFEGKNRRTKFIIPTSSAGKYFEQMGDALVLASTSHSPFHK